jgi:hypothetical protein
MDGIPSIQRAEMAADSLTAVRQAKLGHMKSLPDGPRQSKNAKQLPESLLLLVSSKTDYRPLQALYQKFISAITASIQLLSIASSNDLGIVCRQRKYFSHPIAVFRRCNSSCARIQSRADCQ